MKILVKYMYSGEATVPKDILNVVLKAGDILKIKGLYREPVDEDPNKISSKSGQLPSTDTKTSETTSVVNKNPPPLVPSR